MKNRKLFMVTALVWGVLLFAALVSSATSFLSIVLNGPEPVFWSNSSQVAFYYVPSSDSAIENCSLNLNGVVNQTDNEIEAGENSFESYLEEKYYVWSIDCFAHEINTTNSTSYNSSEERELFVDLTPPVVELLSPEQGFNTLSRDLRFEFNVSDNLDDELLCYVQIDQESHELNASLGVNNLDVNDIGYGDHEWNVVCYDNANNLYQTLNRSLTVNVENVSFSITTDKPEYRVNEQVDMIINAPIETELEIIIFKQGQSVPYDVFTTTITNPQTTFFRSFSTNSTYEVNASFDYHGYTELMSISFKVIKSILSVSIAVDDDFVKVNQDIHFDAQVSNNVGTVSYKWDFTNDGSVDSTSKEVDYDYGHDGSKVVNLTVKDNLEEVSTLRTIEVREEHKLHFKILENVTDTPIENVTIELDNDEKHTNDNGELDWYVLEDEYALGVRKSGYYSYFKDIDVDEDESFTIKLNKKIKDITPPQITLISPEDNKIINTDRVNLKFIAIDESKFNCTVFYSEYANWFKSLEINRSMQNNTETTVGIEELEEGKNYWKVECTDAYQKKGVSSRFMFTVELPTSKSQETVAASGTNEDDLGVWSNKIILDIDETLNSISAYNPEQKDVAGAIDLRKHLDEAKNELQKVRRDVHNLRFMDEGSAEEREERTRLRSAIEEIEGSTIKEIIVQNSAEFTRYPTDEDIERLSDEYLAAKELELSKRQREEFIQNNIDAQALLTISTRAWNVEVKYVSGDKDSFTLIEKSAFFSGDYKGYSLIEFIPKSAAENIKDIEFLTLFSTIQSDPIVKLGLNSENKSVYYIKKEVSLAEIDKTNTLLIYDGVEGFSSKVTGFASLGAIGGFGSLGFAVVFFLVLIGGYFVYQRDMVDVSVVKDLKERFQSRKEVSQIRELADLAHIKLQNKDVEDARRVYGEINLLYREIPQSCRAALFGDLVGLSKQIDIHHINALVEDANNFLKYNQYASAVEIYNKIRKVYKNFEKPQRNLVQNKVIKLFEEVKRTQNGEQARK